VIPFVNLRLLGGGGESVVGRPPDDVLLYSYLGAMTDPKVFSIAPRLIKNTQEQSRVHTSHKAISIVVMLYVEVRSKRITIFFA
jgi:hypothetical protein